MNRKSAVLQVALVLLFLARVTQAQSSAAKSSSSELIGQLTKQLSITPAQATGGAGALFGLAKSRLSAPDFGKIATVVPGMKGLLRAAPNVGGSNTGIPGLSSLSGAIPSGVTGLAGTAQSFQKLGLSPDMVGKFVPIITQFVQSKGGAHVASLLSGALK